MAGERLIDFCRSAPEDTEQQLRIGAEIIASDPDLNSAAEDCHAVICDSLGREIDPDFQTKFQRSWAEFSVNALSNILPIQPAVTLSLESLRPIKEPTLCLLWHFPEYPLLMQRFMRDRIFSIVGDNAAWTIPLVEQGLAGNFRTRSGLLTLRRALRARRSIAAAIDYCYADTRSLAVPFMGEMCDTPAGIVEYCLAHGYQLQVITVRRGEAFAINLDPDRCGDVRASLETANIVVADEIMRDPGRWLMWPSLGSRVSRTAQYARRIAA